MFNKLFGRTKQNKSNQTQDETLPKPELKQFGDLKLSDFERSPIWVGCHTFDYGKPWYEKTNEETFRPWNEKTPIDPSKGMFLIKSEFIFADGSHWEGFVTPISGEGEAPENTLGTIQPHLFTQSDLMIGFWGGMFGFKPEYSAKFYQLISKTPNEVFPIKFSCRPNLSQGIQSGTLKGFYSSRDLKTINVAM